MSQNLRVLENFLALSEAMARAAAAQEWDSLARADEERGTLADKLPDDLGAQLPPSEQGQARTLIERCQHLDAQTRTLVEERQKSLRILLRETSP
ncbi:flagellar protein FliT [Propionivibrio sp.]|uniref:flagellar protein FliT n=1 Tax=Propionivibrio sp. TaxID=2212460 RepID=UPI00261DE35B|nr:flagellar protein FliT [Propionivibrio sp.]